MRMAEVSELRVPGADAVLSRYLQNGSEAVQTAAWEVARHLELNTLVERAAHDAVSDKLPLKTRLTAILALRGGRYSAVETGFATRPRLAPGIEYSSGCHRIPGRFRRSKDCNGAAGGFPEPVVPNEKKRVL